MASNKRRPDMHWDRPVADVKRIVKRFTAEDVPMYFGPCGPLDRETRRQEAAAVAALRGGAEDASVWGIAARLWINATDRESDQTATGCACTSDRAAAEDRKAAAPAEGGPVRGMASAAARRAAYRARRADVAADALTCERRPVDAAEAGMWGTVAESAATLKMMGIWRMAEGEWSRQGEAEARRAERANAAEVVTVRRADGSTSTYVPDTSGASPLIANVTRRMERAATRGTAEAAEARAAHAASEARRRAEGEGRAARKAAEAARSAARRAAARAARKA